MQEVGNMHVGQSQGDWSHVGRCRSISRFRGDTAMTVFQVVRFTGGPFSRSSLDRVELELVGLLGKVLARDATTRLRLVVHAAGWLHSMVLHGRAGVVVTTSCWYRYQRHSLST